jgi:hypothetical protein
MSRNMLLTISLGLAMLAGTGVAEETIAPGPAQVMKAAAMITPAADLKAATTDAGFQACVTAESALDYCLVYDPRSDIRFNKCLCCSSTSFIPQTFDAYARSCASYLSTSLTRSTSQYTLYSSLGTFCSAGGNVCAASATTSGRVTSRTGSVVPSGITSAPRVCTSAAGLVDSCLSEVPNFESLRPASQAECLCYVSASGVTSWVPSVFDGYASSCAASLTGNTSARSGKSLSRRPNNKGSPLLTSTQSSRPMPVSAGPWATCCQPLVESPAPRRPPRGPLSRASARPARPPAQPQRP